ncbi:MAG: TonB-dependent receptor plug domain-containing protein [Bacteroidota bacterium]
MKRILFLFPSILLQATAFTQSDSSRTLEEVVVTATRQERRLGNVAVPVTLIHRQQIQQTGSLRLRDILQEQPGLFLTSGFGSGVQLQGLNPEHTLILIDGQPLVGRTSGILDLNRIAVAGIKRIEIVKGPSSSLYGSEAMAGVINLITESPGPRSLEASLRYGVGNPDRGWALPFSTNSFQQTDLNLQAGYHLGKWKCKQSNDLLFSDGISFRPFSTDRVPRPIRRLTHQTTLLRALGTKAELRILLRANQDRIQQEFSVRNNGQTIDSYGREQNHELNLQPTLTIRATKNMRVHTRGYFTRYVGDQQLNFLQKPDSSYLDRFEQNLFRGEQQIDWSLSSSDLVFGIGYQIDQARSTRYDALSSRKQNRMAYAFGQWEWRLHEKWISIAGVRYDDNQQFAAAFTPKWALRYKPNEKWSFNASVGQGFKAPDFRQLYLNFTNNAAGGYSVYGTQDAIRIITALDRLGQIAELKPDFARLSQLTPEYATGLNGGVEYRLGQSFSFRVNGFRNDIRSLIDVRQVATRIDGSQIFSYLNVRRAFTEGVETDFSFQWKSRWQLSTGYQWLRTGDKDERDRIRKGLEYVRNPDGTSRVMLLREYVGLPNRSAHQAQAKFRFQPAVDRFVFLRLIYRSRWTVANSNGNGIHDVQDEYARGFVQVNLSGGLPINTHWSLQGGIDNLLNYQDVNNLPNLPGRNIYLTLNFKR